MPYVLDNLLPNEIIKYEGKVHIFYPLLSGVGVLFGLMVLIAGGGVFGLAIIVPFLYNIIFHLTTEIFVTDQRILYKTGIIARNVFELQLKQVESVTLNQTIFQRIINAGRLVVNGTGGHSGFILGLNTPTKMRNMIYATIEK